MQKNNKKLRFNIIDFLITVIILLVVALLAYIFVFSGKGENTSNTTKITYVLEVRDVRDEIVPKALANEGATVIEGTSKYNLGKIVEISSKKATIDSCDPETGEYLEVDFANHQHVSFIVEAEAVKDSRTGRYGINGFEISIGTLVYLRLPNFSGTAYCRRISE